MRIRRLWPNPTFGDGESPTSFLSRSAALHGRSPRSFCRDMALSFQGIVDGCRSALSALAHLTGIDPERLEQEAIRKVGPRVYEWRGERITRIAMQRATVRICAGCIVRDMGGTDGDRAAAYGRTIWQLDPLRACPDHGLALLPIGTASGPGALHDFASAIAIRLPAISELERSAHPVQPSPMEAYLLGRLEGRGNGGWLDRLAWHAAADACQTLGAVRLYGSQAALNDLSEGQWRTAGMAGYAIAANGEAGIRDFLAELDGSFIGSRQSKDGPQAHYGPLFKRIAFTLDETDFDPLREVIMTHVHETTAVGAVDELFGQRFGKRIMHSIRTASVEHDIHHKRLRKILVAKGVLSASSSKTTDERCIFPADENEDLLRKIASAVSLTEAETYLNAGRVQTKLLADAGFIRPFVELGAKTWGEKNFAPTDLDAFLRKLSEQAIPVDPAPIGTFDIPGAAKRANCGAAEVLRLILDRKLKWVGLLTTTVGYMSVLVDLAEIKQNVHGAARMQYTARELEKRLSTNTKVVAALIENGQLPTSTIVNPVNRCPTRVVRPEDVAAFEAQYVSLNALATACGRHFIQVKKSLEVRGVRPALPKETFHATFYRRSETNGL